MNTATAATENILPLAIAPRAKQTSEDRFKIIEFENPRTSSKSWRVTGIKRDGTRIRKNYSDEGAAKCYKIELETEWLKKDAKPEIRSTRMSEEQISLAEAAFIRLGEDSELPLAVEYWLTHGKQNAVAVSPRLDEAYLKFTEWLELAKFRDRTKGNLKTRVNVFCNSVANLRVCDVTPETIDGFLDARTVSAATKDNDRRAVSRFFSFCIDRKRRWATVNPCRAVTVDQDEASAPQVLTVDQCRNLLKAAQKFKGGRLLPYVAVCLFGGLRPFEASRLDWSAVFLKDREIKLRGDQTKTGESRTVKICDTLAAWLKVCEGKPFYPSNWRKDFDTLKEQIGYGPELRDKKPTGFKPWPEDVLRHTAISHYFRKTMSFGDTAEQFGNSESVIKKHYKSNVSSDDTKKFYALRPAKGGRK